MMIPPKPISDYPWLIRVIFWRQKKTYGKILDPVLLWGRSAWVFSALALLYRALNRKTSPLSPVLRAMITVRVSQVNHCAFCVDINTATLLKQGVSETIVDAVQDWKTSDLFTEEERLALEYAEAMTVTIPGVSDDLRERLKESFSEDAIIELTSLIAFQNMSSKFNAALDVPPQGFCRFPLQQGLTEGAERSSE